MSQQDLPPEILKTLQLEYVASFEDKAREIMSAYQDKNCAQLQHLLHKLAGSGKTYDFAELSKVAREAEQLLLKEAQLSPQLDESLSRLLNELKKIRSQFAAV